MKIESVVRKSPGGNSPRYPSRNFANHRRIVTRSRLGDIKSAPPGIGSPTHYAVTVEGSHSIFDGSFEGVVLSKKFPREALQKVVFGNFLKLYRESYGKL